MDLGIAYFQTDTVLKTINTWIPMADSTWDLREPFLKKGCVSSSDVNMLNGPTAAERPKHVDGHHICTRPQGQLDEPQLPRDAEHRWASVPWKPKKCIARAQHPSIPVIGKTKRLTWKSVNCHGHLSIWDGHLSSSIHFDASSWHRYVPCMLGGPFRSFRKTTSSLGLE